MLLTAKGAHHFLNSGYVHVDRGILDGQQQVKVFSDRGSLTLGARSAIESERELSPCRRCGGPPPRHPADRPMRSPPAPLGQLRFWSSTTALGAFVLTDSMPFVAEALVL